MILKEEKINLGRQRELDVVKALAIIFMITIHVYEELSAADYSVVCAAPLDVILQFLGGPLAAPVFMFSLGLGLSYSKHREPVTLMKRGLRLFLFSYLFNVLRYAIPYVLSVGFANIVPLELLALLFHIDILPFAGLTFMIIGLLKKRQVSVYGVFGLAIVLQAVGIVVASVVPFESLFSVFFFGLFVKTSFLSYFPFCQWFIYPALGLLYAKYLRHIENTDALYKTMFAISAAGLLSFCAALYAIGYDVRSLFTLADEQYYAQTFLHTFFNLCCIGLELSAVHFILKVVHLPKLGNVIAFMSSKLNSIYIVQWMLIGWLSYFAVSEDSLLSVPMTVPVGLGLTVVSTLLVLAYVNIRKKRQARQKA